MIQTSRDADEQEVFTRFLQTHPGLIDRPWQYVGAHHERPDFVFLEEKIGVELAEWLDPTQTGAARELDRFENEINERIADSRLTPFIKSFEPSAEKRYYVIVRVRRVPRRNERESAIDALLDYLPKIEKPNTDQERKIGVSVGLDQLPKNISRYFDFLSIHGSRGTINLGVTFERGGSFDSNDAVNALLARIKDKLVVKRELYSEAKREKGLRQLWLLVHYGRGLAWNTPYCGLGLRDGGPLDEETDRQIIRERAHKFISEIGPGPFDKVLLLFDMEPGFECIRLF